MNQKYPYSPLFSFGTRFNIVANDEPLETITMLDCATLASVIGGLHA